MSKFKALGHVLTVLEEWQKYWGYSGEPTPEAKDLKNRLKFLYVNCSNCHDSIFNWKYVIKTDKIENATRCSKCNMSPTHKIVYVASGAYAGDGKYTIEIMENN